MLFASHFDIIAAKTIGEFDTHRTTLNTPHFNDNWNNTPATRPGGSDSGRVPFPSETLPFLIQQLPHDVIEHFQMAGVCLENKEQTRPSILMPF